MKNVTSRMQSVSEIRRVTLWGAFLNIVLAIMKVSVGLFSNSQALVADGIHSISDLVTDFAIFFGAKYWNAPPDKEHPYGHGRLEAIVNIGIGLLLAFVAFGIAWDSINSISNDIVDIPGWDVFFIAICSIILKEILFRWTVAKGKVLKSHSLVANGWHHRSDALSSIPVACSVLGAHLIPNINYLDQIAAIIVTIMILKAAWRIVTPSFKEIMDSTEGKELENRVVQLAKNYSDIKDIHAFRSRRIGSAILIDFHLLVDPDMSVDKAHTLSTEFKQVLINQELEVIDVIIHIEPFND